MAPADFPGGSHWPPRVIGFTLFLLSRNPGLKRDARQKGNAVNWYVAVLKNYAGFSGRAHRTEYWMFFLVNFVISVVLNILSTWAKVFSFIDLIYALAVLIPSIAVGVRRLHDTGRTGWWTLIGLIPIIGTIILIVFLATDGQPGDNEYGPNPKHAPAVA
ncbi:DUF805 domain-containing protein [Actinoallomurus sp. CA-142502]|uniref:DUF805 domain-containing protein n=1 Tax=Actinoallomurus sp. CA-142502 TaxID=3239885 RepID=UPI003D8D71C6